MSQITIHFHGEITFFLSKTHQPHHSIDYKTSIKDFIEALGVPHPEIEQIIVNQQAVDFDFSLLEDETHDVQVYSDIQQDNTAPLRPPLTAKPRFILDTHLGRLANILRMMGFDTLYRNDYPDDELAFVSNQETRVLLTRDIGLLKRSLVIYGRFVRETDPHKQIIEIMRAFKLLPYVEPFKHCIKCNGLLHRVEKADVIDRIPENSANHFEIFHQCADCHQVYWKGSHYNKMQSYIDEVMALG